MAPIANFAVERGCQSAIPVIAVPRTNCVAQRRFSGQAPIGLGPCSRQFQRPFRVNAARTLPAINRAAILVRPHPIKGVLHGEIRKVPPNDHCNHDTTNEREGRTGVASVYACDHQL
jgi:hypothetical protein